MQVIRIQFKPVGKKYYFSPNNIDLKDGDKVVVETVRGIEMGTVIGDVMEIDEKELVSELKPILRKASKKDIEDYNIAKEKEKGVKEKTKFYAINNGLEMKILGCEYTLDLGKLIIYFEAEGRVDFRQLVKDLAEEFKVRIELRQVGPRDGAKFIGGLGPCGLKICCVTHIDDFDNVTIKMAKNQNLSLNPQKISGTCGKLLCCIKYEDDVYKEARENLPDIGDTVKTKDGIGKVIGLDILKGMIQVKFPDEKFVTINKNEVIESRAHKQNNDDEKLRSLE
ncbi:MAG: stage 0 sporulation family protein [Acholeplasmatales bacterium]|nr:stage 0 sporulation family protein [Acholeplasmatales bacterium]